MKGVERMPGDLSITIYIAIFNQNYRIFYTHNPGIDARLYLNLDPNAEMIFLTPFLPVGIAFHIYKKVFLTSETYGRLSFNLMKFADAKHRLLKEALENLDAQIFQKAVPVWNQEFAEYPINVSAKFLADKGDFQEEDLFPVKKSLEGRLLYLEELEQALEQNDYHKCHPLNDILQWLSLTGQVEIFPALVIGDQGRVKCIRCGNEGKTNFYESRCGVCDSESIFCQQCVNYGEARLCRAMFCRIPSKEQAVQHKNYRALARNKMPELSPAQQGASKELVHFIKRKEKQMCLLWAVAGAGKTEVVLEAINMSLREGGHVLYAAPRRDVVIELAPRIQYYFPGPPIAESYGGSRLKYLNTDMVAATTHQVLRYYRRFDLVILDEADAYPYKGSEMLHMGVRRAVKKRGQIINLTATPNHDILTEVKKSKAALVTIPARHHGYPLPEPKLHQASPFIGEPATAVHPFIIDLLTEWLRDDKRQVFVFLPTVSMVDRYGPLLQHELTAKLKMHKDINPESVDQYLMRFSHAKDKERDEKRDAFKEGKVRVFLTTTIMERGITVKKANVLVLNADYEKVFDQGTLIQMAGRAGRSREYPQGEVVFMGPKISGAMKEALANIQFLNRTARQKGYLKRGL